MHQNIINPKVLHYSMINHLLVPIREGRKQIQMLIKIMKVALKIPRILLNLAKIKTKIP